MHRYFCIHIAANGAILLRKPLFAQAPHLLLYSVEVTFYDRTELMSFSSPIFKGKNEPQKIEELLTQIVT